MLKIHHRFETLSEADSGKEHLFTWDDNAGATLLRTMYQSGGDLIPALTPDGQPTQCKRGSVLRIQPDTSCTDFAPSHDAQTGCIALQIEDGAWDASHYAQLAQRIRDDYGFSHAQQAAVFSQLASLYNLMATQYDKVFDLPLTKPNHESLNQLVTDPRRLALSQWFAQHAEYLLDSAEPAPSPLQLPEPPAPSADSANYAHFIHTIHPVAGKKQHQFQVTTKDAEPLVAASYESGSWGETMWLTFPQPLSPHAGTDGCPTVSIPFHTRDFGSDETPQVLDARTQLARINYLKNNYLISDAQAAAGMMLVASVYRLAATHYQAAFDPKPVQDHASLSNYIRNADYQRESDSLLRAAYLQMHERLELKAPFRQHHQARNLSPDSGPAMYADTRMKELETAIAEVQETPENQHVLDLSFIPLQDNARFVKEYVIRGALPSTVPQPCSMVYHEIATMQFSRAK